MTITKEAHRLGIQATILNYQLGSVSGLQEVHFRLFLGNCAEGEWVGIPTEEEIHHKLSFLQLQEKTCKQLYWRVELFAKKSFAEELGKPRLGYVGHYEAEGEPLYLKRHCPTCGGGFGTCAYPICIQCGQKLYWEE